MPRPWPKRHLLCRVDSRFSEDGFAVIPRVLSEPELADWRAVVRNAVTEQPPPAGHTGPYFLWPQFPPTGHPLLELYTAGRIPDLVQELLRPGLTPQPPTFGQIALTLPPHVHRPGGPHIDGLTPTEPDGRPGTFTVLAGVLLTDQRDQDRGNLWVWPGTHRHRSPRPLAPGGDRPARRVRRHGWRTTGTLAACDAF